jgi:hypothetical protein
MNFLKTTKLVSDDSNNVVGVDGVNDYMRIVRSSSMSPTSGLTQEVWFNYPSVPTTAIFIGLQYGASTNNTYALWKENATTIMGGVNTSGSFSYIGMGTTNLVGNRWYHLVHTYDGSTQKLYLDGVLMTTGSQSGTIQYDVNNTRVLIGADDNIGYNSGASYPHPGKMGQVRIYNRGLSAAEVLKNYNAQRKRYFQEDNIVTNGLMVYLDAANTRSYPGTGNTWYDLSGSGNTSALTNGPTFNSSNLGAFVLDGSNDYILVNSQANILSKTAYTKIAYIYISNFSTVNNIISGGFSGQHAFWMFGTVRLNAGHNSIWNTVVGATSLSLNTWYFAAVTYSNSTGWKLYLNGREDGTSVDTTTFTGNQEIVIGAFSSSNNFTGRIASVQIYNRALTSQEIVQNYNATKKRYGL